MDAPRGTPTHTPAHAWIQAETGVKKALNKGKEKRIKGKQTQEENKISPPALAVTLPYTQDMVVHLEIAT